MNPEPLSDFSSVMSAANPAMCSTQNLARLLIPIAPHSWKEVLGNQLGNILES